MERTAAEDVVVAGLPSTSGAHWANRDNDPAKRPTGGRSAPFRRPPALNSFPADDPEPLSPSAYLPNDDAEVPSTSWFAGQEFAGQEFAGRESAGRESAGRDIGVGGAWRPDPGPQGWAPDPGARDARPRPEPAAPEFGPAPPLSPGRISFGVTAGPISPYHNQSSAAPTSPAAGVPGHATHPVRDARSGRDARAGRPGPTEDTGIGQITGPGREIRPHRASRREAREISRDTGAHAHVRDTRLPSAGLPSAGPLSAGLPSAGLPSTGLPSAGLPSTGPQATTTGAHSVGLPSAGAYDTGAHGQVRNTGAHDRVRDTGAHELVTPPQDGTSQEPPTGSPRRSRGLVAATVALSAVVLLGGSIAGVAFFTGDKQDRSSALGAAKVTGKTATAPLDGRKTAAFELVAATTKMNVSTADLGQDLFKITAADDSGVVPSPAVSKTAVQLRLTPEGKGSSGQVNVVLSAKVRWSLRFTGGGDEQIVDLSGGQVAGIDVIGGSRRFELSLPKASGTVPVHVTGAIQDLSIQSPADSPVRVKVQGGAKTVAAGQVTLRDLKPGSTLTPKDWKVANRYDVDAAAWLTLLSVDSAG